MPLLLCYPLDGRGHGDATVAGGGRPLHAVPPRLARVRRHALLGLGLGSGLGLGLGLRLGLGLGLGSRLARVRRHTLCHTEASSE